MRPDTAPTAQVGILAEITPSFERREAGKLTKTIILAANEECGVWGVCQTIGNPAYQGKDDTRFASPVAKAMADKRRAARESDGWNRRGTRGSPLRIGQPRAEFFDTFGVVIVPRLARN